MLARLRRASAERRLYDLYKATETPREWFAELFLHARNVGIEIFASVFSPEDVDFLEQFNPAAYKIATMEIVDVPLIEYAASTGKRTAQWLLSSPAGSVAIEGDALCAG
jgi:sialic acid synthase SpsE